MNASTAISTRSLALARPLNAHLELTYACNWRCVFCYNPRHFDRKRLSTAEWSTVLDDLRALGTLNLTLTGGEPLAHPDFFTIFRSARSRGFAVRIFTNGTLIDARAAREIAAVFPSAVEMSIHGAIAATHDRATMRPGSFDGLMGAIRFLRAEGAPMQLKCPVTSINEGEIDEMIALAARLDVPLRFDPHITPRDDGDLSPLEWRPSTAGLRKLAEIAKATGTLHLPQREEGGVNCGLGRITVAVDPEGNVYPCMQWRHRSVGNVRETPLREMWEGSEVRKEAADVAIAANDAMIAAGGDARFLSFCPALAVQANGDPYRPDEAYLTRARVVREVHEGAPPEGS